jgi:hypothetical protein
MKKIYTLVMGLALSALFYSDVKGQNCPGAAYPYRYPTSCYVLIVGSTPNADVNLYGGDGTVRINLLAPGMDKTDASGAATVFFDCNSSVVAITLTTSTGGCALFAIAAEANLPIKLKSFTAAVVGGSTASLKWTSALESNSSHYEVEKSTDGKNYTVIGTVRAAGNSYVDLNYTFSDSKLSTASFYRLKMVDIDGNTGYSKVVYVNTGAGGTSTLSVFPNPFRSEIQLKGVSAAEVNKQNIKVFNVSGKEVGYRINGSNSILIDAGLPQGVYILRVKDQTYKLFKSE